MTAERAGSAERSCFAFHPSPVKTKDGVIADEAAGIVLFADARIGELTEEIVAVNPAKRSPGRGGKNTVPAGNDIPGRTATRIEALAAEGISLRVDDESRSFLM